MALDFVKLSKSTQVSRLSRSTKKIISARFIEIGKNKIIDEVITVKNQLLILAIYRYEIPLLQETCFYNEYDSF